MCMCVRACFCVHECAYVCMSVRTCVCFLPKWSDVLCPIFPWLFLVTSQAWSWRRENLSVLANVPAVSCCRCFPQSLLSSSLRLSAELLDTPRKQMFYIHICLSPRPRFANCYLPWNSFAQRWRPLGHEVSIMAELDLFDVGCAQNAIVIDKMSSGKCQAFRYSGTEAFGFVTIILTKLFISLGWSFRLPDTNTWK